MAIGDWQRWGVAGGVAAAFLLGLAVSAAPVAAQTSDPALTRISPPPQARAQPQRTRGLPPAPPDEAEDAAVATEAVAGPVAEPEPAEDDATGLAANEEGESGGARPSVIVAAPDPVAGGVVPLQMGTEARLDPASAGFTIPSAGYDPFLFGSDIGPLLARRAPLFLFEPYEPMGVRIGSFVLLSEIEAGVKWTSNVLQSQDRHADSALELRPSARLVSNWSRHAVEVRGVAALTYFDEFSSENDHAYEIEARGRFDFTGRTNVEVLLSRDVAQESRSSIDAPLGASGRANVITELAAIALNHRFNRLSLQLRGAVTDVDYGDTSDPALGTISNADRDTTMTEEAVRATWEFKPTLFAFIETAINQREHKQAALSDGISRDSAGERYRVGLSFGTTGQWLRGEASIGWAHQRPDDSRLDDIEGVIVDANLEWRVNALTGLRLTARSDIAETTLAGSSGALTRLAGVEIRHAFRERLIGTAGITVAHRDYAGVDFTEREIRSAIGLEYHVSRETALYTRYEHVQFDTTDDARNYNADEIRVGVRVRR